MKELKPGDIYTNEHPDASGVASHCRRTDYHTVLYRDGIRTVAVPDGNSKCFACKVRGYADWYVGQWVANSMDDNIAILSGPHKKLKGALVALKLEVA